MHLQIARRVCMWWSPLSSLLSADKKIMTFAAEFHAFGFMAADKVNTL
jgi:hypothetical protein